MNKIKVLHSAECSGAKSGFGKYGRELFKRLSQNDRLELAELGSFCAIEEQVKYAHVKGWKFYPASVIPQHPRWNEFNSNPNNHFGFWRFDRTLLDFKPHFVMSIRDVYNCPQYIVTSPLRKFFNAVYMTTCDSIPLRTHWNEIHRDFDGILTYSDWCHDYLKKINGLNLIGSAYPGVDFEIFKPQDKIECRRKLGLPEDAYIIGFVARNQIRKWFPEIFKTLRLYLDKYGHTEIGKKTYLYIHTSYPDHGWDLVDLLNEFGVSDRVFFSYVCGATQTATAQKFSGIKVHSFASNQISLQTPNTTFGFTEEQLSTMYNTIDLYVQYVTNEGSGMPHLEASACGIPSAGTYYSATADVIDKTGGIKLQPAGMPRDFNLMADRSIPNNQETADSIFKFFNLDKKYKEKKGKQARDAAKIYFNWDRTTKVWSDYFENTPLTGLQGQWNAPLQFNDFNISPLDQCPKNLSNLQYMQWLSVFVAKDPLLITQYTGLDLMNKLNVEHWPGAHFSRQTLYDIFANIGRNKIMAEQARVGILQVGKEDYIEFAEEHLKSQ